MDTEKEGQNFQITRRKKVKGEGIVYLPTIVKILPAVKFCYVNCMQKTRQCSVCVSKEQPASTAMFLYGLCQRTFAGVCTERIHLPAPLFVNTNDLGILEHS